MLDVLVVFAIYLQWCFVLTLMLMPITFGIWYAAGTADFGATLLSLLFWFAPIARLPPMPITRSRWRSMPVYLIAFYAPRC